MTKSERRLRVLKDALKQLKAEKYLANTGAIFCHADYSELGMLFAEAQLSDQVQPLLIKALEHEKPQCEVCARGALLISRIKLENKLCIAELYQGAAEGGSFDPASKVDGYLLKLFSAQQIALMENAFETHTIYGSINHHKLSEEGSRTSWNFGRKYNKPSARLIAIFQNAIHNGGIFKP